MLVEMKNADRCCGFGGVMRITHGELSNVIGGDKAAKIIATGASAVVTGCPSCRMQITEALRRAGSHIDVVHTVQILEEALVSAE
jgi:glycolate oxidase iron-sulfur subunit